MYFIDVLHGDAPGLHEAQRLRAQVYLGASLEDPANITPDGRYVDTNDAYSLHIMARALTGEIVGTVKLTPRLRGKPMKLERDVPRSRIQHKNQAVELARLAVHEDYRNSRVALALWQAAFRQVLKLDVEHVYSLNRLGVLIGQEKLGLPVRRLGMPVKGQFGLTLYPSLTYASEVIAGLYRKQPAIAYYFAHDVEGGVLDTQAILSPPAAQFAAFCADMETIALRSVS